MDLEASDLCTEVRKCICAFLSGGEKLPGNERDLQMNLARFLAENSEWNVELEYFLPSEKLGAEYKKGWGKKVYLDIVVSRGGEYLPIELKSKTKLIHLGSAKLKRFGDVCELNEVLSNQSAQDEGRYDFWRDVRRLQLVCKQFKKVKKGLSVFVTNDESYRKNAEGTTSAQFNMDPQVKRLWGDQWKWEQGNSKKWPQEKDRPSRPFL